MNKFANITLALLFSGISLNALADDLKSLPAEELINACKTMSESASKRNKTWVDSGLCRGYIKGYFSATDKVITTENIPSDLTLRAMKTRGVRLSEEQSDMLVARYCISEKETLGNIVNKIANVDASISKGKSAADILKYVLSEHYPCASN